MQQGARNHSICHDLGTEHVHWGSQSHKACTQSISAVALHVALMGNGQHAFSGCTASFLLVLLVYLFFISLLGNNFLCVWIRRAICDSSTGTSGPVLTNMLFHSLCSIKTRGTASKLVTLTLHFSKGSSGKLLILIYPLVSVVSWFSPSLISTTFLVTTDLRGSFCASCTIFTLSSSCD